MTSEQRDETYSDRILDHIESPYHRGALDGPTCARTERNPLCGDQVRLELRIDAGGRILEAYFDGRGCAISQAAASILCRHIEGKSAEELREFQTADMLRLLQVPLSRSRQRCGLVAFKALQAMIASREDAGSEIRQST